MSFGTIPSSPKRNSKLTTRSPSSWITTSSHRWTKSLFFLQASEQWMATKPKGPHVALLVEYDALSDIRHPSCHNLIVEECVAIAIATKAFLKAACKPFMKVSLLSTPVEEQRGGKLSFIKAQIFQDVDFTITAHPSSQYYTFRPNYVAISEVSVHFT